MFKRVAIVGLGTTGASIGLALRTGRQAKAAQQVAGYDSNKGMSDRARKMGATDITASQLAEAVSEAELIVLATPVGAMRALLQQLASLAAPGAVITDVASTKVAVISWAEEYLPSSIGFVGGHPILPKTSGAQDMPDAALFQQCIYCLTPTKRTPPAALEKVAALVEAVGAKARFLEPPEHDGMVAGTTQLPLLASIALLQTVVGNPSWGDASLLAGNSIREATSLVTNTTGTLRESLLTNSEANTRWLDDYMKYLREIRDYIATHDTSLGEVLARATKLREQLK